MTDKLADAARKLIDRWETPSWKDVPATGEFINSLRNALTAHEAAKAATPDDVREALVVMDHTWAGYQYAKDIVRDAALRNTQGVPREVVDALRLAAPIVWKDALNTACVLSCPTDEATTAQVAMTKALALLDQHARGG